MVWVTVLACAPQPGGGDGASTPNPPSPPGPVGTLGLAQIAVRLTGEAGDQAGWDLAGTDLDGDGGADLAVVSQHEDAGVAVVVAPLTSGPLASVADLHDVRGAAVAGVGDMDGDGTGEFALTVATATSSGGGGIGRLAADDVVLVVVSGSDPSSVAAHVHAPDADEWNGSGPGDIETVGDASGDGLADLAFGNDGAGTRGEVFLLDGPLPADASTTDAALVVYGTQADRYAGLGAGGDWDADGVPDLAIHHWPSGDEPSGLVLVGGDTDGAVAIGQASYAEVVGVLYETDVYPTRGAGDLDGDGTDDLVVREETGEGGRAAIAWGPVAGTEAVAELDGVAGDATDWLESIAVAGDLDADGVDDLVLGAPGPWDQPGSVALVYGPISGRVAYDDADARLVGEVNHSETGHAVAPLGDVDRDGYDDLGVGAYLAAQDSTDTDEAGGAVYVVFGGPRPLSPRPPTRGLPEFSPWLSRIAALAC